VKKLILVLAVAIAAVTANAVAKTDAPATTSFHGIGPAGFKIDGKTNALDVKEDGANYVVTVPLKDITTGISLRDNHMRNKYLEVDKFPETHLTFAKSAVNVGGEGDAKGTLTLHGKTKELPFHYTTKCNGDVCDAKATIAINMNDFGIVIPVYLGVTMKPDVTVETTFQAKK
jgi:polyisoprenoid-binding protein YceI